MDNSSDVVLTKRVTARLEIICCFNHSSSHIFLLHNKTLRSDAESREEQHGSKQKFVGGMTAKLWPNFCQDVAKNTEKS